MKASSNKSSRRRHLPVLSWRSVQFVTVLVGMYLCVANGLLGHQYYTTTTTTPCASRLFYPQTASPRITETSPYHRFHQRKSLLVQFSEANDNPNGEVEPNNIASRSTASPSPAEVTRRRRIRSLVKDIAKKVVPRQFTSSYAQPEAIAEVLKEATVRAIDEVLHRDPRVQTFKFSNNDSETHMSSLLSEDGEELEAVIDQAFAPVERSLENLEQNLVQARVSLQSAKNQAKEAVSVVQAAALAQVEGAASAVKKAEDLASRKAVAEIYATVNQVDVESLAYEDVDFASAEMAPPFLDDNQCMVPGEAVVRVEKAPENSRRIFAGIDILASVDTVWQVLTDYENLQNVVPNLAVNQVVQVFEGKNTSKIEIDVSQSELDQCKSMADQLKGAVLKQVGKATVAGIKFSARTTLEVREWPEGLPDFAHFYDDMWQGRSRKDRALDYAKVPLKRYSFPRPFAISTLPTRDITMQSVEDDDGEFRMYQGVWRLQPLPGCAPKSSRGLSAMRLTYAVEVSPRAYLPVQLIEGRVAKDLVSNLMAIRKYVTKMELQRGVSSWS